MAKDQAPNTVAALELIDISAAGGPTVVINGARTVDVIGFGVSDIIIDVAIHCRKAMQRGDGALRVHLLTTFKTLSGKSRLTTNADLCVSVAGRKVQFSVEPIGATRDASEAILYIFPVEQLAHTGELGSPARPQSPLQSFSIPKHPEASSGVGPVCVTSKGVA